MCDVLGEADPEERLATLERRAPAAAPARPASSRAGAWLFRYRGTLLLPLVLPAFLTVDALGSPWGVAAGCALVALAVTFRLAAVRVLGRSARVHSVHGQVLLTTGVYARTRNPIYVAGVLFGTGWVLIAGFPLLAILAGLAICALYSAVIRVEERALEAGVGAAAFERYARATPRWLPTGRPGPPGARVPWREVLCREAGYVAGALLLPLFLPVRAHLYGPAMARLAEAAGLTQRSLELAAALALTALAVSVCGARTWQKHRRKERLRLERQQKNGICS
jgi:protein-S-isoprenylcysteine O-methyltransferase Ste14